MNMKKMLAVVAAASLVAVAAPAFANPFSDVPLNHWAYDAVETLAAKGILEGYPDDTFRGKKAMTRYEIATMVARMMANENVGGEDIEQLKALIVEFGPELEALGVKVDGFDSRLAKLEKGLSGWKLTGQMRFDYKNFDYDGSGVDQDTGNDRSGFTTDRARLFMHRDLDNGVSFDSRWHADRFDRYWLTVKDFFIDGLTVRLGKFAVDYDAEDHLYEGGVSTSTDAWLGDHGYTGAELRYSNGTFEIGAFAASNDGGNVYDANTSADIYGGRIKFTAGEKFFISLNAMWYSDEKTYTDSTTKVTESDVDNYDTYWAAIGYQVTPGFDIRAAYYIQDIDTFAGKEVVNDDDPNAFKIILDIKQDLLKFTSLWVEYNQFDEGFILQQSPHYFDTKKSDVSQYYAAEDDLNGDGAGRLTADHTEIYAFLKQQWTPKVSTFLLYDYIDADGEGYTDSNQWGIGVGYQYSPALYFEVSYLDQDGKPQEDEYENKMFRFRTLFNF